MKIINPATEEIIKEIKEDSLQSLEKKFQVLRVSQPGWYQISLPDRIAVLKNFSGLLEETIESLASVLTSLVGKPLQQSRNELHGVRTRIQWLTGNASKYLSDEVMNRD